MVSIRKNRQSVVVFCLFANQTTPSLYLVKNRFAPVFSNLSFRLPKKAATLEKTAALEQHSFRDAYFADKFMPKANFHASPSLT